MKLVHITTVPETFTFFRGQIAYMKGKGFEVHAISSSGNALEEVGLREGIPFHPIEMARQITPFADLKALFQLYMLLRKLRPTIVHAHTPKGGFLGVLAARMARIPVVFYTVHGLPFVTATGLKRRLLYWVETLTCHMAHAVTAVSFSTLNQVISAGICPRGKIKVLAYGSYNGVDAEMRFNPAKVLPGVRQGIWDFFQIPPHSQVLGYVGRIVRDKGLVELEAAWQSLRAKFPKLYLLLVGGEEEQDPLPKEVLERLRQDQRVGFAGWQDDPTPFYAGMDILVLPTYREGFPVSLMEAASMELPVVATNVDGCVEAVIHGVTGFLVPPKDSLALEEAISNLLSVPGLRTQMGKAGRRRMLTQFKAEIIWEEIYLEYSTQIMLKKLI